METSNRLGGVTGITVQNGTQFEIVDNGVNANFSIASGAILTLSGTGPAGGGAPCSTSLRAIRPAAPLS